MFQQSRYALEFFRKNGIKFWQMTNNNSRSSSGSTDRVLESRDGTTLVISRRSNPGSNINMSDLTGSYSVRWYNPSEGGLLQQGSVTTIVAGSSSFVSYGDSPNLPDNDWVVLIEKL
jgi:Putative collagen-binding domain of a collagenase